MKKFIVLSALLALALVPMVAMAQPLNEGTLGPTYCISCTGESQASASLTASYDQGVFYSDAHDFIITDNHDKTKSLTLSGYGALNGGLADFSFGDGDPFSVTGTDVYGFFTGNVSLTYVDNNDKTKSFDNIHQIGEGISGGANLAASSIADVTVVGGATSLAISGAYQTLRQNTWDVAFTLNAPAWNGSTVTGSGATHYNGGTFAVTGASSLN